MPLFLDTCALAKRYTCEGESSRRMQEITSRSRDWSGFVVSGLIEPEVISTLAKKARAHTFHRTVHLQRHPRVVETFRRELSRAWFTIVGLGDEQVEAAAQLLTRYPEFDIGAADAIHLATALAVQEEIGCQDPLVFVSADRGLLCAAGAMGLRVYNPTDQTVAAVERVFR